MPNAPNPARPSGNPSRMKLVEIAGKLDKVSGNPTKHHLRARTAGGFRRMARVARALDVFCDACKAKETSRTIRYDGPAGIVTALRKAIRES